MFKIWMKRVLVLTICLWVFHTIVFYLLQELTVSYRNITYLIEIESKSDVSLQYSLNKSPSQIGANFSTFNLKKGLNTVEVVRPRYIEVKEIHFYSVDTASLYLNKISFNNILGEVYFAGCQLAESVKIKSTVVGSTDTISCEGNQVPILLRSKFTTFTILNEVLSRMDNDLLKWQQWLAIILTSMFFVPLLIWLLKISDNSLNYNGSILCLLFLSFLFVPLFTQKDNRSYENRDLKPFPDLNVNIWKIPSEYNKFYNDHFPFRRSLRSMSDRIKYTIFRESPRPNLVQIGKKNWLFYSEKKVIDLYQGVDIYSMSELELIRENLEKKADFLSKRGIAFYMVIPPLKHRIYTELLPKKLQPLRSTTKFEQLMSYMKEHSSIKLIDPYGTLMEHKQDHEVYYATDAHWNMLGAFYVYQLIIDRIREDFPSISPTLQLADFNISQKVVYTGDLVGILDMENTFSRNSYSLIPKVTNKSILMAVGDRLESETSYVYYNNNDKLKPRMLLYRDSFSEYLRDHLSVHFSYTGVSWSRQLTEERILKDKPDIIIFEVMERFIDDLLIN